jgi:hypothetical protein
LSLRYSLSVCAPAEKEKAEKRAAELEARSTKLEAELDALRKEQEGRRAEEEAALQARNAVASRLRSVASVLAGECSAGFASSAGPNVVAESVESDFAATFGHALPSVDSGVSDVVQSAVEVVEDVGEVAKAVADKASSALLALHEGVFPEKEVPVGLKGLASAFDAEGEFLADFARDNTVRGLESTLAVLLGHGATCNFDEMTSSFPVVTAATLKRAKSLAQQLQGTLERRARR